MKKILFCSHGRLCEGMLDTLKVFSLYDEKTMQAIPFYTEGVDSDRLLEEAAAQIGPQDQLLILTDIAFGSVNQQIMIRFKDWDNVFVLSGMNLMIVLSVLAPTEKWTEDFFAEKTLEARDSIVSMGSLPVTMEEEDE